MRELGPEVHGKVGADQVLIFDGVAANLNHEFR